MKNVNEQVPIDEYVNSGLIDSKGIESYKRLRKLYDRHSLEQKIDYLHIPLVYQHIQQMLLLFSHTIDHHMVLEQILFKHIGLKI